MNKDVVYGGNIGLPLISLIKKKHDFYICEFSSYQAADLHIAPNITILTNLFPEHIDWHLTHENYYKDKVNIFNHQNEDDISIINANCVKSQKYAKKAKNIKFFNQEKSFYVKNNEIYFENKEVLSLENIKLEGKHNLENITAVLTLMNELSLDINKVVKEIKSFASLPHRLENIGIYKGVEFINDSISTTPETAIAAVKSFNGKDKILILGGYDRKQDYGKLAKFVNDRDDIKMVIAINQTADRIIKEFKICKNIVIFKAKDIEHAVELCYKNSKDNDMVIFSPAAPSYEVYKNFMERGEIFTKFVKDYKK
jgi:UDP-N-acetylmuramoylalanine--D-glutamate ligase